jgi:hypothetical protein
LLSVSLNLSMAVGASVSAFVAVDSAETGAVAESELDVSEVESDSESDPSVIPSTDHPIPEMIYATTSANPTAHRMGKNMVLWAARGSIEMHERTWLLTRYSNDCS